MKPFILFLIGFCAPLSLLAQDDMYFVPSKSEAKEPVVTYTPVEVSRDVVRDVDEYNRRGAYAESAAAINDSADYVDEDAPEMSCTERIILFHSPSVGVVISSPYYWDYYYDPWWYGSWRWPYYAWSSWWWYDPRYPGWGWGPPYWGHVHWPHRPLNVGSGLGQWRPGPTGGYVRYGNGYRRPSTGQFTTNRPGSVNTGRFGTTTNRRFSTGRRNFNMNRQSGTNQENNRTFNNNRRFNNSRSNNSMQQRSEQSFSPSRSYSSPGRSFGSPGRSTGTSRGGGRSFGGRR